MSGIIADDLTKNKPLSKEEIKKIRIY